MLSIAVMAFFYMITINPLKDLLELIQAKVTNENSTQIMKGIENFYFKYGRFPYPGGRECGEEGLFALICEPDDFEFMWSQSTDISQKKIQLDAWGNSIEYQVHSDSDYQKNVIAEIIFLDRDWLNRKTNTKVLNQKLTREVKEELLLVSQALERAAYNKKDLIKSLNEITKDCQKNHLPISELSGYLQGSEMVDQWNHPFKWHRDLERFYSMGADQVDQSCQKNQFDLRDIY